MQSSIHQLVFEGLSEALFNKLCIIVDASRCPCGYCCNSKCHKCWAIGNPDTGVHRFQPTRKVGFLIQFVYCIEDEFSGTILTNPTCACIFRISQYQIDMKETVLKKAEKLETGGWSAYLS